MKVSENILSQQLIKICGSKNITNYPEILREYSTDMSFFKGIMPKFVIWPSKTQEILKILKLANQMNFCIISCKLKL